MGNIEKSFKKYTEAKISSISSSDLSKKGTWDPNKILANEPHVNKESLNTQIGIKVADLLEKYSLYIYDISRGDYLKRNEILLPDEHEYLEYRVRFSVIQSFENFVESNTATSVDELSEEELKEFETQYEKEKNLEPESVPGGENMTFSVFLPGGVTNNETIKLLALSDATNYLNSLYKSALDVTKEYFEPDVLKQDKETIDQFKKFLDIKKIKISNKNIEVIRDVSYRLYKDSKVFYNIKETIGESTYNKFIHDWLNIK